MAFFFPPRAQPSGRSLLPLPPFYAHSNRGNLQSWAKAGNPRRSGRARVYVRVLCVHGCGFSRFLSCPRSPDEADDAVVWSLAAAPARINTHPGFLLPRPPAPGQAGTRQANPSLPRHFALNFLPGGHFFFTYLCSDLFHGDVKQHSARRRSMAKTLADVLRDCQEKGRGQLFCQSALAGCGRPRRCRRGGSVAKTKPEHYVSF